MLKDPQFDSPFKAYATQAITNTAHRFGKLLRLVQDVSEVKPEALAEPLCERPLILRHEDDLRALHQEAFLASAKRHATRAGSLHSRNRVQLATLHHKTAILLQAFAQPGEVERLPLIQRPGPATSAKRRGVHPAIIAFAEGAAEEFFGLYTTSAPSESSSTSLGSHTVSLLAAFRRANFHRIYIARLMELDGLFREGRISPFAEATLMRRYGPQHI